MNILLMAIGGYYINGYWLLFYKWLLVILLTIILLVDIGGYSINGYFIGG
jgi:hypothetical protein